MNQGGQEKLMAILRECDVHAGRVEYARGECSRLFPLTSDSCRTLSDDEVAHVDQLIYRFTKLRDALGAKLFPAIVGYLREDAESLTVLDRLAHLERAQVISNAERWQELRELRNQLAHDYQNDGETAAGYLNELYETSATLLTYHTQANQFVRERILPDNGSPS